MKLYELSNNFTELFGQFEDISNYTFDKDSDGNYVDDDGNIIDDPVAAVEEMLSAWFDTLSGIEGEFEQKAENIGAYIKQLEAEADALTAEKKKLDVRIKAKNNEIERMKNYLVQQMQTINLKKVDMPMAKITWYEGRDSIDISNEKGLIEWAEKHCTSILNPQPPKIVKKEISALLKSGETVPYASVVKTPYISIK